MIGNQEVPARKPRSRTEKRRLVLEFGASGLRENEFSRALTRCSANLKSGHQDDNELTAWASCRAIPPHRPGQRPCRRFASAQWRCFLVPDASIRRASAEQSLSPSE